MLWEGKVKVVESGAVVAGGEEEGRLVEEEERVRRASWGWVSASLP